MIILHLTSENTWRGGEQQLSYLILQQKEDKETTPIVIGRKSSLIASWCEEQNVEFIAANFSGSFDPLTTYQLLKICKEKSADIMHAHTSHAHASALYSKFIGNPTKLILHRKVAFPIKSNRFSRFKYQSSKISKIICISKKVRQVLVETTKQPDKTVIVYDSVDLSRYKNLIEYNESFQERYKLPKDKLIITNTSALSAEKDYFTFIDTAKACIDKGINAIFLIIGSGNLDSELQSYIESQDMKSHVFMLGFIQDINDVLEHTDFMLITSKQEGLGSSILDAFATKVPVIATNAGGIPEIIIHKKTGMLADVGDSTGLADHIQTLLDSPSLVNDLVTNSSAMLHDQFLVSKNYQLMKTIYSNALHDEAT